MILKGIYLPKVKVKKGRNGSLDPYYQSQGWKKLRAYKYQMNPLCEDCLEKGLTVEGHTVDHVLPRNQGGSDLLWNLRTRCKKCNAIKTALDNPNIQ